MKHKILIGLLAIMAILTTVPNDIYAATKETTVSISKNYTSATFKITAEESGDYTAVLTSPSGVEYVCNSIDDMTLSCTVDKVTSGDWTLVITDEKKSELPKFSVSISQTKENETNSVSNAISVGKDINGLSVYLKNDTIVAEWTDDTVGKVNIKVINLDSSETLANQTVSEKYFSCDIPNGTENVMIDIVPSTSSNIDGATLSYSFAIDNYPDAQIEYPDYEYTNTDSVSVNVTLHDTYSIYVENNGLKVYTENNVPAGDYVYDIPLSYDGENALSFYLIDENGNMRSTDAVFLKDTEAPYLIMEGYEGISTSDSVYTITGTVKNFDTLTINDIPVDVATDGTFIYDVSLHIGTNDVRIAASDIAGNVSTYDVSITMLEEKENSVSVKSILAFFVILFFLAYVIISKKKKKNPKETEKKILRSKFNKEILEEPSAVRKEEERVVTVPEKKSLTLVKSEERPQIKTNDSEQTKPSVLHKLLTNTYVSTFLITSVVLIILFNFIVLLGCVKSGSMEPTLITGTYNVSNRLAYIVRSPQRGDIITFHKDGELYSKRVIGIAGDQIQFADGYVYLNGERFDESEYLDENVETNCTKTFTVPDGYVFVLGDNRENSYDSRGWDNPYVSTDDIVSKYLFNVPFLRTSKYD